MKKVLVTGGNSGIGKAFAEMFLENGHRVFVLDKKTDRLEASGGLASYHQAEPAEPSPSRLAEPSPAEQTEPSPRRLAGYCACDLRDTEHLASCFQKIRQVLGSLDILINAAGMQIVESFEEYDFARWKDVMDSNYFGTCNVISEAIKLMANGATILNVLSVHASRPRTGKIAYDSSKSALEMLTKELALELAPRGITVNGLSFGAVDTDMNAEWRLFPERRETARAKVPLQIIFQPEDIARFGYVVCAEFAPYTTGSIFTVDGGRSLL